MSNAGRITRRLLFATLLAVSLGGCALWQNIQSTAAVAATPEAVKLEIDSFDAYEALADGYNRLRLCNGSNGPVCRDPAVRKTVAASVLAGRSARNNLKAYLRANPGQTAPQIDYSTLVNATDAIKQALQVYKSAIQ